MLSPGYHRDMSGDSLDNADADYRLKLEGGGLSLDQKVDRATAVAIVNLVLGGGAPLSAPQPPAATTVTHGSAALDPAIQGTSTLSVGEFIAQVEAKRNPDKIVAMGVYMKEQGHTEFTPEDIKPLFQAAGEPTPANFARDYRWAQNAKWIAPAAANPKAFYVTNTGEDAVRAHFPSEIRKATAQPVRKKTRKQSAGSSS
jgi:hypothetical protein